MDLRQVGHQVAAMAIKDSKPRPVRSTRQGHDNVMSVLDMAATTWVRLGLYSYVCVVAWLCVLYLHRATPSLHA